MIFKEVKYKDSNSKFDWEEVPQEDLWEDGELNLRDVEQKILLHVLDEGDWVIARRIDG